MESKVVQSQPVSGTLYRGTDPREIPAYSISEAARYVGVHPRTLRSWVKGQSYQTKGGERWFAALIRAPSSEGLSFMNLLEAHVLTALRQQRFVPMRDIRQVLNRILRQNPGTRFPLATHRFATLGRKLFLEEAEGHTTPSGQAAFASFLDAYLQRIEHGADGWGAKLYPFPRFLMGQANAPRSVSMSPQLAFGRPVLDGTRIPTSIIAQRLVTGETPEEIAEDYDRGVGEILDAIRWELAPAA
jgi:uncharacterized protein (DUF433 family)/transposase-like protein